MENKKPKNVFKEGAISSQFIGDSIAKHQSKTGIGAHNIFLGQVRADEVDGKIVAAIEYTAYEDMANQNFMKLEKPHSISLTLIVCTFITVLEK